MKATHVLTAWHSQKWNNNTVTTIEPAFILIFVLHAVFPLVDLQVDTHGQPISLTPDVH